MAGNWKNSGYGAGLREEYGRCPHIHLLEPVYEPGRINFLRSRAAMYIHGHSAGGTNPLLVEAMYLGLPVFSFLKISEMTGFPAGTIFFAFPPRLRESSFSARCLSNPELLGCDGSRLTETAGRR